jgi:hypothetical protein
MKRTTLLLLSLLSLLVLGSAITVWAQTRNCSTITYSISTVITGSMAPCSGPQGYSPGGYHYLQTTYFKVWGYQTQSNATYAGPMNVALAQEGRCWVMPTGWLVVCTPLYSYAKNIPVYDGTAQDQLTLQSLDGAYAGGSTCGISYGATVFYQCQTQPCQAKCTPLTCPDSPIVIDLTGKGFSLTDAKNGVSFDIKGTGSPVQMGWTARGAQNAFLALPGSDGLVHNGKELFGNFTPQPPSDTPNGFAALAVYDDPKNGGNGDGIIDARDAVFKSLRLWVDANHDGIAQPEELHTLPELGVNSISLKYREDAMKDQYGNAFRYRARLNPDRPTEDGRITYDIFFVILSK